MKVYQQYRQVNTLDRHQIVSGNWGNESGMEMEMEIEMEMSGASQES